MYCEFGNPRDIIIIVRDIKDPDAHADTDNTIKLIKEDKEYIIIVIRLQEETKAYVKNLQVLNKIIPKLYGIL